MSKIVNEARIKNKLIVRIRELLEHRAFWLYLLVDEAEKRGLPTVSGIDLLLYEMRHFAGHRPAEKERHQEPQGSEKDAVHPRGQMGL